MRIQFTTSVFLVAVVLFFAAEASTAGVSAYLGLGMTKPTGEVSGGELGSALRVGAGIGLARGIEVVPEGSMYTLPNAKPVDNQGSDERVDMTAWCVGVVLNFRPWQAVAGSGERKAEPMVGLLVGKAAVWGYKHWVSEQTWLYSSSSAQATLVGVTAGLRLSHMFFELRYIHGSMRQNDITMVPFSIGFCF